jgi:hypothetical protein
MTGCDKEDLILGSWNLQHVFINGEEIKEPEEPEESEEPEKSNKPEEFNLILNKTYYHFHVGNSLNVTTITNNGEPLSSLDGYYIFTNKVKSKIEMKFALKYKRYHIFAIIKKLTRKEMHMEYEQNGDHYLLKFYTW